MGCIEISECPAPPFHLWSRVRRSEGVGKRGARLVLRNGVMGWFFRTISRMSTKTRDDRGWIEGVERRVSDLGHDDVSICAWGSLGYLVSLMGHEWWTRRAGSSKPKCPSRRSVRLARA